MSDAPAAPVTENGVPPVAQEKVEETPGFKVFAGNLAYITTDEGLKAFFAPVQEDIITAQVILRGTRSAGYGFVSLNTAEAAQKAVDLLHQKELDGRTVIVEIAKPADQKEARKERKVKRKPGRRGSKAVPGELTEAEANGQLVKADGAAPATSDDAAKPKKKKKNNRKTKAKGDEGSPVEGAEGEAVDGEKKTRQRKPRAPRPQRAAGEEPVGEPSKTMLFVANLGFTIADEDLAAIFTDAGIPVNSARIVRRRWGKPRKSKGYGFVDVGDEANQNKAIELLQGKEVGGRPIAVKVAVNSQQQEAEEAEADAEAEAAGATEVKAESPETTVVAS
ncbi:RNA recognition motif (RRM) domain-containing protein [Phanerochaete sordida]|uniref:RNA recognition motif (RRM) domain-containing protein n=1 Tax=Phanerochaete sordida TaxID=48140 RepID=A0A9P3FYJ7_9APHY|nr:RNA recognition motif (RRM) domain-containing protein [Phanerochaete sordida]